MNNSVRRLLERANAVVTDGHFVYTSGRHGSVYLNKDALYPDGRMRSRLAFEIARQFRGEYINVVIGPAIGGAILAMYVADKLHRRPLWPVSGIYAEKQADGAFAIKRGFDMLVRGKRTLVVEDILTTGASARGVVEAVRACKGMVIGVSAICNRGKVTTAMLADVPRLESIVDLDLESWSEEECRLCEQGIPINTELGKGREFLAKKKQHSAT